MFGRLVRLIFWLYLTVPLALRAAPVLVDTAWVAERLDNPKIVLIDMSDGLQYRRFHLPKAIHFASNRLYVPRPVDRVPVRPADDALYTLLGEHNIAIDKHVVIYDDVGGLNAGRLFWELERIGHPEVSVMNGGLVQWILEGRRVVNTDQPPIRTTYVPAMQGRDNEVGFQDVEGLAKDASARLLDVRTWQEYTGDPRQSRSGHIPSARFWPWDSSVDFDRGFVRKSADVLLESLRAAGVADQSSPVVTYCQSGHRAAQAYLTLRSLGFDNVRLYSNSMNEYQRANNAPLVTGPNP